MLQPKMHGELELFTTKGALFHTAMQFYHSMKIFAEG